MSKNIRHEVPAGTAAALVDVTNNSAVQQLIWIEEKNHFHCDFLSRNGFDGSQLRLDAPKQTRYVAVTASPHSKERVKAIKAAKTAVSYSMPRVENTLIQMSFSRLEK